MKTLPIVLLLISSILLSGCGAMRNSVSKMGDGMSAKDYTVTVYSGATAVKSYQVKNSFINSEEASDGWFFYVNGKLVRVSGTVVVEEN
jgi:hypothetical protein